MGNSRLRPTRAIPALTLLLVCGCTNTATNGAAGGATGGTLYINGDTRSYVYKVDLQGGTATKIAAGADPFVTPDGMLLCIDTNNGDLGEYTADGTTFHTIVKKNIQAPFDQTYDDNFQNPQLSPDGQYVAYEGQLSYTFDVYVVERATGKLVASANPKQVGVGYVRPTWTPDNRLVVAGGPNDVGLYVSDAGFTKFTRFDPDLSHPDQPAVSPDGTTVAFVMNDDVYTIEIDGTGLTQVTQTTDKESWPSWSPDGKSIAFYNDTTVVLFPLGGGDPVDMHTLNDQFTTFNAFREYQMSWR